jgi:hypothetical protein
MVMSYGQGKKSNNDAKWLIIPGCGLALVEATAIRKD